MVCESIFKLLKNDAPTKWIEECQTAFEAIKNYLSNLPVLVPPRERSPLLLYLSVSDSAFRCKLRKRFRKIEFRHTPRIKNELVDALATIALMIKHPNIDYIDPLGIELKEHPVHCSHVEEEPDAWGMDFIGPIEPTASNGHRFILVTLDYFIKWVEAASYKSVTKKFVANFVRNNLICRFGVPESIITNNGANLNSHLMREICEKFNITHRNSTSYRPQMNGAVEATNKNIKNILRKMIDNH
nr:uncharacterized protein LOC104645271 [Solanum lycopersicum]